MSEGFERIVEFIKQRPAIAILGGGGLVILLLARKKSGEPIAPVDFGTVTYQQNYGGGGSGGIPPIPEPKGEPIPLPAPIPNPGWNDPPTPLAYDPPRPINDPPPDPNPGQECHDPMGRPEPCPPGPEYIGSLPPGKKFIDELTAGWSLVRR
jgi:hypothetical protein